MKAELGKGLKRAQEWVADRIWVARARIASSGFNRFYQQADHASAIVVTIPPQNGDSHSWTFKRGDESSEALLQKAQETISALSPGTETTFTLLDESGRLLNSVTLRKKSSRVS